MSQLAERFVSTGQPGGVWNVLCRFVAVMLQGHGWHEPYKSRDLRTVLWAAGGAIPPADPATGFFDYSMRPDECIDFPRIAHAGRR